MISKFEDFKNESNSIEDLTKYELEIVNRFSHLKKCGTDSMIDLGKITNVPKVNIDNIKRIFPDSEIITKNGRYILIVKEEPKIIENFSEELMKDQDLNKKYLYEDIDKIAEHKLNSNEFNLYKLFKPNIIDKIEKNFNIMVFENQKYMKAFENIYYELKYFNTKISKMDERLSLIENSLKNVIDKNNLKI